MQVLCSVCKEGFEIRTQVHVMGKGMVKCNPFPSQIIVPAHPPIAGKQKSFIIEEYSGEVIRSICNGSLRSPSAIS